jgi:Domain of unknown function (DUF4180)
MSFVVASEIGLRIDSPSDVIDAIGQCYGSSGLLLAETDLASDFFVLQTGLACELLQKCTQYQILLALVVPDLSQYSPRIAELVHEHRNHRQIRFFADVESAKFWLEANS